jgi:hypothetical protein
MNCYYKGESLMKKILAAVICCVSVSTARAAAPNYSDTATTRIFRGQPSQLVQQDTHTDSASVSASVVHTEGGASATGDATAGFNELHVRSSSVATNSSSTALTAISVAQWNDRLFFRRNGQDITSGDIAVVVHAQGVVDFQPPSPNEWLTFGVTFGNGGGGIGLGFNGSYDQFYDITSLGHSWSASDGLALQFNMVGSASNTGTILSGLVDFSAGARITNISLLGPNGLPDPTVSITASSGVVYGVPESQIWLLALCGLGIFALVSRMRLSMWSTRLSPIGP